MGTSQRPAKWEQGELFPWGTFNRPPPPPTLVFGLTMIRFKPPLLHVSSRRAQEQLYLLLIPVNCYQARRSAVRVCDSCCIFTQLRKLHVLHSILLCYLSYNILYYYKIRMYNIYV